MSIIGAALISFFAFSMLTWYFTREQMRRLVSFAFLIDITMHGTVLVMFIDKSTLGLMQAELSAIMFSLSLHGYRWAFGYRKLERRGMRLRWRLVPGRLAKE